MGVGAARRRDTLPDATRNRVHATLDHLTHSRTGDTRDGDTWTGRRPLHRRALHQVRRGTTTKKKDNPLPAPRVSSRGVDRLGSAAANLKLVTAAQKGARTPLHCVPREHTNHYAVIHEAPAGPLCSEHVVVTGSDEMRARHLGVMERMEGRRWRADREEV